MIDRCLIADLDIDSDEGISFFIISDNNEERKYEKGTDCLHRRNQCRQGVAILPVL